MVPWLQPQDSSVGHLCSLVSKRYSPSSHRTCHMSQGACLHQKDRAPRDSWCSVATRSDMEKPLSSYLQCIPNQPPIIKQLIIACNFGAEIRVRVNKKSSGVRSLLIPGRSGDLTNLLCLLLLTTQALVPGTALLEGCWEGLLQQ